jgi:DNA replication initiation complex subunit (GINS family)
MYDTLFQAWIKEREETELQKLPKDFYQEATEYINRIRQESRMLDRHSTKAKLISDEMSRAAKLLEELAKLRLQKLTRTAMTTNFSNSKALTSEEERIFTQLTPSLEAFHTLLKGALRGKRQKLEKKAKQSKRKTVRFLKEVPAIVGVDLKIYGPFSPEDVGSLPVENAQVLVKRGVAAEVEIG